MMLKIKSTQETYLEETNVMIKKYSSELNGCIISKTHIEQILSHMGSIFEKGNITFVFTNSTEVSCSSLEEFKSINFENKIIKSLRIVYYEFNVKKNIPSQDFTLDYDVFSEVYTISISSEDNDEYSKMKTFVDEWILSVQSQWRKRLAIIEKYSFVASIFFGLILGIVSGTGLCKLFNWKITEVAAINTYSIFITVSFFFIELLFYVFKRCFPRTEIDLGINRHKRTRVLAWILLMQVIWPFVLFIIGLVYKK